MDLSTQMVDFCPDCGSYVGLLGEDGDGTATAGGVERRFDLEHIDPIERMLVRALINGVHTEVAGDLISGDLFFLVTQKDFFSALKEHPEYKENIYATARDWYYIKEAQAVIVEMNKKREITFQYTFEEDDVQKEWLDVIAGCRASQGGFCLSEHRAPGDVATT
jgi:PAS domain-containing protein